mgnify:CR=1 FL=1
MKMDKVAGSGNDEFFTPRYAVVPILKYIVPDFSIWCPFDTEDSNIVKALRENGNEVVATHIHSGDDFFGATRQCDVIISNPPYSKKTEVFDRLFKLGIPFAMLVGVVGLFESKKRFELFSSNNFEIMWMSRRVAYLRNQEDLIPSLNPPFSSVWLTRYILPKENVFEKI